MKITITQQENDLFSIYTDTNKERKMKHYCFRIYNGLKYLTIVITT